MSSIEYAHRFAPCPVYDLEGMEHWLEKLALEGLFLSTSGFFGTYGTFEKREPKAVRYRMQPLQKKKYYEDDGLTHRAAREPQRNMAGPLCVPLRTTPFTPATIQPSGSWTPTHEFRLLPSVNCIKSGETFFLAVWL